jgi:aconitate hydratase
LFFLSIFKADVTSQPLMQSNLPFLAYQSRRHRANMIYVVRRMSENFAIVRSRLNRLLTFAGAIECHDPGVQSLSCTGMGTICNTGAEIGATTSLFPFNDRIYDYLKATKCQHIDDFSRAYANGLTGDAGAEYDQLIEINLSELEPHINSPFTPGLATPISKYNEAVETNRWPEELKADLTGSCTNSSYEDMPSAILIAHDALNHGIVTPGSEATFERDGQLQTLEEFGGAIEQWDRRDVNKGERISTFFRITVV